MGNVKKNQWFIAIKKRGADLFDLSGLTIVQPKEGFYHADPFLFKNLIFFELYDYNKGVIACMEKDGSNIRKVLEEPWHLSFPFIIQEGKETYMVPESGAGPIRLYRCVQFPDTWEYVKTLVEGAFGDTVIYRRRTNFLMFSTEGDNNLRIWQADHIEGPWRLTLAEAYMHSRPAGNIFYNEDRLIRPTQHGQVYGEQVFFKEFDFPYQEKIIDELKPTWHPGLTGTHTFNFDETHVVIDGRIKLEQP